MANLAYDKGKKALVDWLITQTLKVALFSTAYTPAVGDDFMSAIVANEIGVSGYAREAIAGMVAVQDDANTRAYFTASNNVWAALAVGATIGWAVLFIDSGSDATSKLIGAYQTTSTPTNGGSFTIQWASGASVPGGVVQVS